MPVVPLEVNEAIYDFSGGLNIKAIKTLQEPNDLSDILNWEYQPAGGLKTRGGKTTLNSSASAGFDTFPVYGLFPFYIAGGTSQLLAIANNKFWKYNAAGNNFTQITITGGDFTGSQRAFSFCQFTDTAGVSWCVICNGLDSPIYYNGTTATRLSSLGSPHADWAGAVQPVQIVAHRNRLYAFTTNRPKVYASNVGSITNMRDWTTTAATAQIELQAEYGNITALQPFYTTLVIFFKDSIRRLDGTSPDDYSALPPLVTAVIGCENFRTVQIVGNDLMFASRAGIHSLQSTFQFGDIKTAFLSEKIDSGAGGSGAVASWTDVNKGSGRLDTDACSVYYPTRNQYWMAFERTTSTTNDTQFVADVRVNQPRTAWTIFDYTPASLALVDSGRISLASAVSGQIKKDLVLFGDYSGVVWVHDLGETDNAAAITARFQKVSKGRDNGSVHKSYRHLIMWTKNTGANLTLTDTYDLGDAGSGFGVSQTLSTGTVGGSLTLGVSWILGSSAFGTSSGFGPHRVDLAGQGRVQELKVEYSGTVGSTVMGYDVQAKPIRMVTQN